MKNNMIERNRAVRITAIFVALALAAGWVFCAPAEEKKSYSLYTTTSQIMAPISLTMPVYNRITVAGWIEMRGKAVHGRDNQSISVSDQGCFTAADTIIVVKKEPVVTKRDDGAWEISFR